MQIDQAFTSSQRTLSNHPGGKVVVKMKKNEQTKSVIVQEQYFLNPNTLALKSAQATDYYSIVYESDHIFKIRQTPLQIIQQSFLRNWSTYEAVCSAIKRKTNYHQKIPILLFHIQSLKQQHFYNFPEIPFISSLPFINILCYFPTKSPHRFDNIWIAYHRLCKNNMPFQHPKKNHLSIVTFDCGIQLKVDVSPYVLHQQISRSIHIMALAYESAI